MNLGSGLGNFIKVREPGRIFGSDTVGAQRHLERFPDTVRKPDTAYTSAEQIRPGTKGF